MSEHANKREKRLAMLVVAAVVLFTVLLIVETFRLLLPGLWSAFSAGDEQALSEYLASQGRLRIFISLPFPTLLTCAAGSFMLEGNWLFTVLTGIVLFSFVGILFFNRTKFIAWAHEVKNRHTQKAGA